MWRSNETSENKVENIAKSDTNFSPTFVDHQKLSDINFNGHYLINNNLSIPKKVINLHISQIIIFLHTSPWLKNLNIDFILNNYLLGSVELTKNADLDKYKYLGWGKGFDSCSEFSFTDRSMGKNILTFGVDMRYEWIRMKSPTK